MSIKLTIMTPSSTYGQDGVKWTWFIMSLETTRIVDKTWTTVSFIERTKIPERCKTKEVSFMVNPAKVHGRLSRPWGWGVEVKGPGPLSGLRRQSLEFHFTACSMRPTINWNWMQARVFGEKKTIDQYISWT